MKRIILQFFSSIRSNYIILLILFSFKIFIITNINCQIYINEFQASNIQSVPEIYDFDDFSDWIELYNDSNNDIDLSGYSITDNINIPQKYVFPEGIKINAKGYLHLWADGYEAIPGQTFDRPWRWSQPFITKFYHIPFKLSKEGEEIALFDSEGKLLDHVIFDIQLEDVSYGRKPDGSDKWFYFGDPTPNNSNNTTGYLDIDFTEKPTTNPMGGFITQNTDVSLNSTSQDANLKYTTDGSTPTENSQIYQYPINIATNTILRVRDFEENKIPGLTETESYIFDNNDYHLPIISITTDPRYLWDDTFGIYTNQIKKRNIPIKLEYFLDKDHKVLSTYAEMKLSGQAAFQYPQKAITITAKSKYGSDYLNYPFFENVDNAKYESIYLRNGGTPDIYYSMLRDALCHSLVINKMDLDVQAYQPTVVYLNGEFWGLYNMREKLIANYFDYNHNANPDNIDLLEYDIHSAFIDINVDEGDSDQYEQLISYLHSNNINQTNNYEYVASQVDIDEYINYMITEIFINNTNWVELNIKWWKEKTQSGKWRWILNDSDVSLGIGYDQPSDNLLNDILSTSKYIPQFTYLFKVFNTKQSFKDEFAQRFAAYLNTLFKSDRTVAIIDSLQNKITDVMPDHINKWKDGPIKYSKFPIKNMDEWNEEIQSMRDFANQRPDYIKEHLMSAYNLESMYQLTTTVSGGKGSIYINGVNIPGKISTGSYFSDIPIRLKAIPKAGYKFIKWEGISNENNITKTFAADTAVIAVFEQTDECIIISKIVNDMTLDANCGHYIALGDIEVKEGAKLTIEEGVEIRMPQSANIYVKGSLEITGNNDKTVLIKPNENIGAKTWGGICFENAESLSILKNLKLINATKGDNTKFIGAISAINSDIALNNVNVNNVRRPFYSEYGNININNCSFKSQQTTDLINVKYANSLIIENCDFIGNNAIDTDAIDLDGVKNGIVRKNKIHGFYGSNSDAIDLGENCKNVIIENNHIYNISDKGISVGQGSKCEIKRNVVIGCELGVGIKDFDSYAVIENNTFYKNSHAVACYEKNIGFGGGSATISNTIMSSSSASSIFFDDKSIITTYYSLSDAETIPGIGNITADPLFVNESILNLELKPNSPCINSGNPNSPKDQDGSNIDMGAYFVYNSSNNNYTIVINEINYNSKAGDFDSGDWVELYNYGNEKIDISNWTFSDDKNEHNYIINSGTILESGEFIIIGNDKQKFTNVFGKGYKFLGDFDFGLSGSGDITRLYDEYLQLVDFVEYDDKYPWSDLADGKGASLMLIDIQLDNNLASSWSKRGFPTPGQDNYNCYADFDPSEDLVCDKNILFTNKSTGIIDSVQWDFGDGQFSTEYQPIHQYEDIGTYYIYLKMFSKNKTNTSLKKIIIQDIFAEFDFIANDNKVTFENNSQNANSFKWDFGDGSFTSDTSRYFDHIYENIGIYEVVLSAKNLSLDCTDEITKEVIINKISTNNLIKKNNILVYPNPFSNNLIIQVIDNIDLEYELFSINGNLISKDSMELSSNNKRMLFDGSDYGAGIYILKIKTKNDIFVYKLFKNK